MKAAIYVRLSDEDRDKKNKEDDSESIQNQKMMLLQYAITNSFDVVGIYNDDDYRGSDRNRPEWNQLLQDAEQRKFNVILCKSQARFTRELEMVEKYLHGLFILWGIRFIGLVDNADTDNKGNKKSRQITGLTNEWFLEDLSDNIKAAFDAKRREGLHIGSFALYGYIKDPNNKGRLIIDEEAAEVVREVFRLFADGYGKTAIARMLNDRGIPNPTAYKALKGIMYKAPKHKSGTHWKYAAISDMLTKEMYIGHMVQGKYGSVSYKSGINKPRPKSQWFRVENTHEPIVDIDLWNRVQDLLRLKAKPFITGEIGLFARKALCANCGCTMRSSKNRGVHYLKCNTRHTAINACVGSFISVSVLEQTVLSELRNLLDESIDRDEVERRIMLTDNIADRIAKLMCDRSTYKKRIEECSNAVKESYLDKVKGIITEAQFIEFSCEFSKEKERIEAVVKDLDDEMSMLERKRDNVKSKRQVINEYSNVERLDRIMVEKLIEYVSVGKRDKTTRQILIEIHWNF